MGEVRVCHVYQEPRNYEEVMALPDVEKRKWQDAMEEEMRYMEKYKVFIENKLHTEHKVISNKCVFKGKL